MCSVPPGKGAQVAFVTFDASAVLVGAMGVGLMRAAFDAALAFAKDDVRGGAVPLLERQAVADLLSGIKIQTEAARALTWKAAHALENGPGIMMRGESWLWQPRCFAVRRRSKRVWMPSMLWGCKSFLCLGVTVC